MCKALDLHDLGISVAISHKKPSFNQSVPTDQVRYWLVFEAKTEQNHMYFTILSINLSYNLKECQMSF